MLTPAFHRKVMQQSFTTLAAALIAGGMISFAVSWSACAQQSAIKRTVLATADQSATDSGAMWVAEIAPGASTGRHTHPTPRFVYVLEGAVVLEMDGKPPRTFTVGEGFVEPPGEVHNFRNASATAPAKAIGFQVAPKGMPLQTNVP
jgi:quercetin dioxygenase-like cupin family protein